MPTGKAGTAAGGPEQWKDIRAHAAQARVLTSDARFTLAAAGTGGGKTFIGAVWAAQEIAKHPDQPGMIVAPTYKVLRDATMPAWLSLVQDTHLAGLWKKTDGHYVLPNGTTIYCASADNPNSIEGKHVKWIWADEAGQYDHWAWVVLQARVGVKLGRVLFTTTPYALNWLFTDIYEPWQNGVPGIQVINWATAQNPYYPRAEIERARLALSPEVFAMRYMGHFVRMEGLVWPDFHTCVVEQAHPFGDVQHVGGQDYGNNTAIVSGVLDANDCLWITETYFRVGGTLDQHTEALRKGTQYWGDPSGAEWIKELRNVRGFDVWPANNDVELGIAAVTERIRTGRLKVVRSANKPLISQVETYHRDEIHGRPVKVDDHCPDALRYLCVMATAKSRPYAGVRVPQDRRPLAIPLLGRRVL